MLEGPTITKLAFGSVNVGRATYNKASCWKGHHSEKLVVGRLANQKASCWKGNKLKLVVGRVIKHKASCWKGHKSES